MSRIDCFFPETTPGISAFTDELSRHELTGGIYPVGNGQNTLTADTLIPGNINSSKSLHHMAEVAKAEYMLIFLNDNKTELGAYSLERFLFIAQTSGAGILYSDYWEKTDGNLIPHPLIDYQKGSLRDDFNFGSMLLIKTKLFKKHIKNVPQYKFAGLYRLRLAISKEEEILRIPEMLYTAVEKDTRKSGKKIFDYVDPKNRLVQIEMEEALTSHLKETSAYIDPLSLKTIDFDQDIFDVEASVIIPVRNREKTIADAINSVMIQKTDFNFNLIIVDNHSTDNTTRIIRKFAKKYNQLIHLIPGRYDLGIGGCWNYAVHDKRCGKFAIQLDSDDLYNSENTLSKIVKQFYAEKCAMVIGSYQMTNFDLEEIPPGIIDHKEWTDDNGMNNALRINGLGAPRAFYTPVLRKIMIPNTSYGEDYAVGLSISGKYKIGRIYEPVYLCRRWDDNSDASLNTEAMNKHNLYKDRIRTIEYMARLNKSNF